MTLPLKKGLDEADRTILSRIHHNARIRNRTLASATGLSESAIRNRIDWLETYDYILGYRTVISPVAFNPKRAMLVRFSVFPASGPETTRFEAGLSRLPGLLDLDALADPGTYAVRAIAPDLHSLLFALADAAAVRVHGYREIGIGRHLRIVGVASPP